MNHWILLITSQIYPQLAKLQIVAWCTFLYKEIWFGWLIYPFVFFCFHDSRASRKLKVATSVGLWSSNETRRRFLDLFDTNWTGKWGWAGGEEELYIFCKHIVCIYIYLYTYIYIFIYIYIYICVCILFRKDLYMIENTHRTSYAWDVHGPMLPCMFLKLNPLHQETTHTLQTSFTSGSLSINASWSSEMEKWTVEL